MSRRRSRAPGQGRVRRRITTRAEVLRRLPPRHERVSSLRAGQEGDDAETLGLEDGSLPGGRYARARLEGQPPGVYALIQPTFERLAQRPDRDPSRPEIEFYRRHDLIDLLLPVN